MAVRHPVLARWLRQALDPLGSPGGPDAPEYSLTRDTEGVWGIRLNGRTLWEGADEKLLPRFMITLNRAATTSTQDHLVLHAAVAGCRSGAIVMPAEAGSGKSTMVATAARRGRSYGGDEHAAIHLVDGTLEPIPKPIALKSGSAELFANFDAGSEGQALAPFFADQLLLGPQFACGGILPRRTTISAVVFPEYRTEGGIDLSPIAPAVALMMLRRNAFNFALTPTRSFRVLTSLVRRVPHYKVSYGDAASCWDVLDDYFP